MSVPRVGSFRGVRHGRASKLAGVAQPVNPRTIRAKTCCLAEPEPMSRPSALLLPSNEQLLDDATHVPEHHEGVSHQFRSVVRSRKGSPTCSHRLCWWHGPTLSSLVSVRATRDERK